MWFVYVLTATLCEYGLWSARLRSTCGLCDSTVCTFHYLLTSISCIHYVSVYVNPVLICKIRMELYLRLCYTFRIWFCVPEAVASLFDIVARFSVPTLVEMEPAAFNLCNIFYGCKSGTFCGRVEHIHWISPEYQAHRMCWLIMLINMVAVVGQSVVEELWDSTCAIFYLPYTTMNILSPLYDHQSLVNWLCCCSFVEWDSAWVLLSGTTPGLDECSGEVADGIRLAGLVCTVYVTLAVVEMC